jgi:hypothetical protein
MKLSALIRKGGYRDGRGSQPSTVRTRSMSVIERTGSGASEFQASFGAGQEKVRVTGRSQEHYPALDSVSMEQKGATPDEFEIPRDQKRNLSTGYVHGAVTRVGRSTSTALGKRKKAEPMEQASGARHASRGSWVCCTCRQTNNPAHNSTRCPIDGHYKCGSCYVY